MVDFVDSDVIVFAFTNNPRKEKCREYLLNTQFITNTLVLIESFSKILTITKNQDLALSAIKSLFKAQNCLITNVDSNLIFESLKRVKKYSLKISDLIHFTSAVVHGCQYIISFDKDFDKTDIPRQDPEQI